MEGCRDPDLPTAMWMKRDTHEALVGCKMDTPMRWILKCSNGIWEGQVGICPAMPASATGSISSPALLPGFASALVPVPAKTPIAYQDFVGLFSPCNIYCFEYLFEVLNDLLTLLM